MTIIGAHVGEEDVVSTASTVAMPCSNAVRVSLSADTFMLIAGAINTAARSPLMRLVEDGSTVACCEA